MITALDLINGAARLIGVLSQAESLSANDASDALLALNQMVDSWSTESLLIYSDSYEEFPLVTGQQSYTMGTGGNFNTTRPQKIENAVLKVSNGQNTFDLPISIVNEDQWASITVKATTSTIPTTLFSEGSFPLETIHLFPVPSTGNTIGIWSWKPLTQFTSLASVVSVPPGYQRALRYNLALELAPEFGRAADALVIAQAEESKNSIKRMNQKPVYLSTDDALIATGRPFNYLTGE